MNDELIVKLLCRLFWLVTQSPGVARYASDVTMFVDAEVSVTKDPARVTALRKLEQIYIDDEHRRGIVD